MTRRALVTGVSSGIGKAITRALLADGWSVIGLSRGYPKGLDAPVGYGAGEFVWLHGNLTTGYKLSWLVEYVEHGLDALIHCGAEQGPVGSFLETDGYDWELCIQTNLIGTTRVLRGALPKLLKSPDGRVLLFAGGGAFNPRPEHTAYAASKAGVVSLMETLAAELTDTSVTVNCVSPGFVPTPMTGHTDGGSHEMDRAVACVMYLLSPAARGLTGKTISAEYDAWQTIHPASVPHLNASAMGTRSRVKIWEVESDGSYVYRTEQNGAGVIV